MSTERNEYIRTYNRIEIKGIANLTDFQQKKIKEATCYQTNYMFENGIEPSNIVGYCVIDISVSVSRNNSLAADLNMSEVSYSILKQTRSEDRRVGREC